MPEGASPMPAVGVPVVPTTGASDSPTAPAAPTAPPTRAKPSKGAPSLTPDFDVTHSGMTVGRFIVMHVLGALLPITAGLLMYGWRALLSILVVCLSAAGATVVWQHIGRRGWRLRVGHSVWLGLLLALTLPPHLLSTTDPVGTSSHAPWPILPAAGVTVVALAWLMGGAAHGRIHPVIIAHLLLVVLFQDMLTPRFTLRREHAFRGDVLNAPPSPRTLRTRGGADALPAPPSLVADSDDPASAANAPRSAWISASRSLAPYHAVRAVPAAQRLESFTAGHEAPERAWISLQSLVRDRLPPLEDLIVGGQPAAIGQGSAIALIIGGLFLLYRGLIDYRVPLLIVATALVCFIVLPIPVVITELGKEFRWLAANDDEAKVGWALGVTFANYELMASPLIFTAFFLATSPAVRPVVRRARAIYGVLVGVAAACFQLYVSVTIGPYLALLAVSMLSQPLDRLFRPRALV
jgi:Na+-translocating ferredoxin:NAD+ oxidoreductase RnfD subunit